MNVEKRRVCVIGCGVIGLSTAVAVQQNTNAHITIISDKLSPNTTGDGAAGLWETKLEEEGPQDKQLSEWILSTGRYLESLIRSRDSGAAGVQILSGYYLSRFHDHVGDWTEHFYGSRKLGQEEIAVFFPNYNYGWFVTALQVQCCRYLPWLMNKFKKSGGDLIKKHIYSLSEISEEYDVIVNCTGLTAGQLVKDPSVYPIRGQVMRVKAPWVKHFIIDMDDDPYIIPCRDTVVVGGTFQKDKSSLEIDAKDSQKIWSGCRKMLPSIIDAEVDHEWVGLRPGRPTVRLERENMKIGKRIIQVVHNYGHGGRGISMHWGCAIDAARLVKDALNDNTKQMSKL